MPTEVCGPGSSRARRAWGGAGGLEEVLPRRQCRRWSPRTGRAGKGGEGSSRERELGTFGGTNGVAARGEGQGEGLWRPPEKPSRCTGRALRVPAAGTNSFSGQRRPRGRYAGGHSISRAEDPGPWSPRAQGSPGDPGSGNSVGCLPKEPSPSPLPSAPSYPRSKGLREGTRLAEPRHVPAPLLDGQAHHRRRCFGGWKLPRAHPPFGWRLGSGCGAGAPHSEAQGGPGESGLS